MTLVKQIEALADANPAEQLWEPKGPIGFL